MIKKTKERLQAIRLRKKGLSYNEILLQVPVAKSTLSLWLRDIGLAKKQKQRLTDKKLKAGLRGAAIRKKQRVDITKRIKEKAGKEIDKISKRELWLIGIALYWAEGEKEKEYRSGVKLGFSNSDPRMVLLYIRWLKETCMVSSSDILYDIYIHETGNHQKAIEFWHNLLSLPKNKIRIYFKHNKIKKIRKNRQNKYYGLIRIQVRKSTNLNRKVTGWIEGICQQCGIV